MCRRRRVLAGGKSVHERKRELLQHPRELRVRVSRGLRGDGNSLCADADRRGRSPRRPDAAARAGRSVTWVRSRKPDLPFKLLRLTPGEGGPHTRAPPRTVRGELLPLRHLCPSGIWKPQFLLVLEQICIFCYRSL